MAKAQDKAQTPAEAQVEYTCAMDKIRDEMAKSKAGYVQMVGEALTEYLQQHPEAEEALLAKDKTIAGAVKAVEDEARKNRTGSMAMVDPVTGFRIIMQYFGIDAKVSFCITAGEDAPTGGATPPQLPEKRPADPFDLDALMGVL